ncbi:hypothetical protein PV328_005023 [Microctonus aethiopoides]|uniref:Uncharacterized protein n=1 Tax=Microctonus aethiopoides TaxID=144406 RepID=A0AA39FLF0_9HYME|nr:hypothetical protein PV328_005023 [Microctonus aethiopoides]
MSEADVDTNYLPIDPFDALEYCTVYECFQSFVQFFMDWYQNACIVTCAVMSDVKTLWIITNGNYLHKGKVVGKLLAYYLIVFAIYVINCGFWIDKKIFKILGKTILNAQKITPVVLALGIIFSFILAAFLLGGTFMSPACKD